MSSIEIKVPELPESVADATIATWHKKPGETVARDENLVDIETDKVVLEVVAPDDGTIEEIIKDAGSNVTAHEVIAKFTKGVVNNSATPVESADPEKAEVKAETKPAAKVDEQSPAVRREVKKENINLDSVTGTGKDGRITKQDLKPQAIASIPVGAREEKRVPMTRLRARIAERLLSAQQSAAILTTFNEINMQPVMDLRTEYKEKFEKAHGVKLGFMSFFVQAVVEALRRFPDVNASIDGGDVVYHGYYDIGIAVSSDRGLVVPVLRDVDAMSMADIEKQIKSYGISAQEGKLSIEDITGGTFTISNGGVFGSLMSTPILNPPQSGILGMHKIEQRPVVIDGQIVVRPMMYVALSYDHRIIDGAQSVGFLVTIKEMLEEPARLLLQA